MTNYAIGQSKGLSVDKIDSLIFAINTTKGLGIAINQGTIISKSKRKHAGGYSNTYYVDSTNNKLLKVERRESLFTKDFTTYYFFNDSIILVNTTKLNIKDGKEVLNGRYYFGNGVLLNRQEKGKPLSRPEAFLQQAGFYLKDFKNIFNL